MVVSVLSPNLPPVKSFLVGAGWSIRTLRRPLHASFGQASLGHHPEPAPLAFWMCFQLVKQAETRPDVLAFRLYLAISPKHSMPGFYEARAAPFGLEFFPDMTSSENSNKFCDVHAMSEETVFEDLLERWAQKAQQLLTWNGLLYFCRMLRVQIPSFMPEFRTCGGLCPAFASGFCLYWCPMFFLLWWFKFVFCFLMLACLY